MSVLSATQKAVYDALVANENVHAFVADRIYDGVPENAPYPYISFGPSDWVEDGAECIEGFLETMQIDVWSSNQSRLWIAKDICAAVHGALHKAKLAIDPGAIVSVWVPSMRVQPEPDGITARGIVLVRMEIEAP